MDDNGTYQLKAENRNGVEKVDLDLIVLDSDHHDCDFFKNGDNTCTCTLSYNGYAAYVALTLFNIVPLALLQKGM